jgi:hypothetical protein
MFNFLKRVLGRVSKSEAAQDVLAAALFVAKTRVERKVDESDRLSADEKALIKEGINALIAEVLKSEE